MDKDWKSVAELVGIAAIVGSLIFVGLQMKQSHEIALAGQYHARAEAVMSMYETMYEAESIPGDPDLRAKLSDSIKPRDIVEALWLWTAYDNHYLQYQAGFLSEDSWRGHLNGILALYNNCSMRFTWEWQKKDSRGDFARLVESLENSCD